MHLCQQRKNNGTMKTNKGGMNCGANAKTEGASLKKQKS